MASLSHGAQPAPVLKDGALPRGLAAPQAVPDLFTASLRFQARLWHEAIGAGSEAAAFVQARLAKDRALMADLAAAGDAPAMLAAWSEAVSDALADYADGAGRASVLAAASAERLIAGATVEARELLAQQPPLNASEAPGDKPRPGPAANQPPPRT